ncbi:hypothetical protein BGX31_003162 [Mortierella sp. GBA43]|nr:hypothetical protein BGX31_003162 [Mortierella sp. GBA43]
MARTFTKQEVASASVVHVSQEGFKIEGTHAHGKPFQMSKPFSSPVRSMSMVKEAFLRATKLSEETSPMTPHRRREIPGQAPGWRTYWPDWTPFLIALATGTLSFFYIHFFPDTSISLFQWIKGVVGIKFISFCVYFTIGLHSFENITAWYLMKRVAKCHFSVQQLLTWSLCVQFLGIGSMLKLLPIVYYSKFVSEEIEHEEQSEALRPLLGLRYT